jgi:biotin transport system substrate-specific component
MRGANIVNEKVFRFPLFAEAVWPQAGLIREIVLVLVGSWLVALTAQIAVPLWPVPITGQTFGALLVGALLGKKRGATSLLVYLGQGAVGFPVFAGGTAGIARLAGPTGGYLVGLVVVAWVVGWLSERGWDRRFATAVAAMLIGNVSIYVFGLPWLANFVGWGAVLRVGLIPFIVGDVLKIVLAGLALPWGRALVGRKGGSGLES